MNRDELLRAFAAHRAAASACERALKGEAEREYVDNRCAVSWRLPGAGTVSASLTTDGASIVDGERETLMDFLEQNYPDEVERIQVRQLVRPHFLTALLEGLLPAKDPDTMQPGETTACYSRVTGAVVPGVIWTKGGVFMHASITPDSGLKRVLAAAARDYVENGTPMLAISPPPVVEPPEVSGG